MGSIDSVDSRLAGKYPAKSHAKRVADHLKSLGYGDGIIYLEAQKTRLIEDNDEPVPFRQRRFFFYLSGCELPDCYLTYNTSTTELTLFIPPIDPDSVIWSGLPLSPSQALKLYDVDKVLPSTEVNARLAHHSQNDKATTVFAIPEQVSEHVTFLNFDRKELTALKKAIEDTRVVKDSYEVALLRKANEVSALAHAAVVDAARSAKNERELEAVFVSACICHGCHEQSYHPIVAGGTNAATLHYQKNDESLGGGRLNLLLDAGGEYRCYCADVTRTFPLNGKFTAESRTIYDIVYEMQTSCFDMLKTGVLWEDVHANAHKVAIRGLKKAGLLLGDEKEIFDRRVSVAFFPHGLGHYLGMDTHDTGGNPNYEDKDTMFRYLRVRGKLSAGAVITVEPGIYFCRFIIEPFLEDKELSKYIDKKVLDKFWEVGGVRIEDNVHITDSGFENLTTAPKEPAGK